MLIRAHSQPHANMPLAWKLFTGNEDTKAIKVDTGGPS